MARAIDGDELLSIERLLDTDVVRQSKTASWLLDQVLHDIQAMPTLTPPNEPLTLEQIKSLYDSPAWYQDLYRKMGYWIIVGVIGEIGVHLTDLDNANEFYSTIDYGARWALFRRPPEGEEGT